MVVFELESAVVEFVAQHTADFYFRSNEESLEMVPPSVWSGYIPRDEVGAIVAGDITTYPAVIVSAQMGTQSDKGDEELVTVNLVIGCFDAALDQQGYRDCCNVLQRLKDRFREHDIIRDAFALQYPLHWQMNKKYGGSGGANSFPYFFAEMQLIFAMPLMPSQYEVGIAEGDDTPGRYADFPIPTPEPTKHSKPAVPPPITWIEH